tara:strand:- start:237 stop:356 length:120 start_codon:yes stop_codon:yes gene_type:complete
MGEFSASGISSIEAADADFCEVLIGLSEAKKMHRASQLK